MSEVWESLKNSLNCKPHSTEVHDPMASRHHRSGQRNKQGKIESSNTKDLAHEKKNHSEKQQRSAILNPVTHEIVLDSTSGEIKICLCCPYPQSNEDGKGVEGPSHRSSRRTTSSRKTHYVDCDKCNVFSKPSASVQKGSNDPPTLTCHRERGDKQKCVEEHDIIENSGKDECFFLLN